MKNLIIIIILLVKSIDIQAQIDIKNDSIITTYLHIKANKLGYRWKDKIIQFTLTNIDSLGNPNWESKQITEFEKEDDYYFVKANIPINVLRNSSDVWCKAIVIKGVDTLTMNYSGVKLSNIKLILKSNPEGAETYLIPNRIWENKFSNVNLNIDDSAIQKYRVNTSITNTYAFVDETVFVVLFKINDVFKQLIHQTKPFSIEPQQTVWINF